MYTRRLLFVRGPPRVGIVAPILAGLATLVALVLLALVIALWPPGPRASPYRSVGGESGSTTHSLEGGLRVPAKQRERPGRTRSI